MTLRTLLSRFFGEALVQLGLVLYQFWGLVNQLGWSTVAIYGLLTLGYGSHVFGRPPSVT